MDRRRAPLLREAIAEIYEGIGAESILVVIPEEGIFLLMHALLEAGDHVVCTFPGYQSLYEVARSIGCELTVWEPIEEVDWRFDMRQLEEIMRVNTKLVVANFPHNPTGYIPAREDFQALINVVRKRGSYLLTSRNLNISSVRR